MYTPNKTSHLFYWIKLKQLLNTNAALIVKYAVSLYMQASHISLVLLSLMILWLHPVMTCIYSMKFIQEEGCHAFEYLATPEKGCIPLLVLSIALVVHVLQTSESVQTFRKSHLTCRKSGSGHSRGRKASTRCWSMLQWGRSRARSQLGGMPHNARRLPEFWPFNTQLVLLGVSGLCIYRSIEAGCEIANEIMMQTSLTAFKL